MEASDELLTIAELSIGLAGFSGAVVAFRRGNGLRVADRFYFIALVSTAATAGLATLVPFLVHHTGSVGVELWARSSVAMLAVWAVLICSLVTYGFWLGDIMGAHHLGRPASVIITTIATLIVPLQMANAIGWPVEAGPFAYILGLILWLSVATMLFVYIVLVGTQK